MMMYVVLHAPCEGAALSFQEERTPSSIESAASPTMLLKKERLSAIVWGVVAGIVTGVAAGILRVVLSTGTAVSAVVIGVGVGSC